MTGYGSERARGSRSARTMMMLPVLAVTAFGALGAAPAAAQNFGGAQAPTEAVDTLALNRIKEEGFKRSQVMSIMSWLTDVHGPRLTASPIAKRAGDWTLAQFKTWGLSNAGYEWFEFGRGWVNDRMVAQVTEPVAFPVIGYPGAWTYGTDGMVKTDVVMVPSTIRTAAEFAPYRGKLKGKIVVSQPPREMTAQWTAPAQRYTQEQLNALANPYPPARAGGAAFGGGRGGRGGQPQQAAAPGGSSLVSLPACFLQEGVAAVLTPGGNNSTGGNVWPGGNGSRAANAARSTPAVTLTPEHYGRIYRILEKGLPVKMDLEVKNTFYDDTKSFNVVAEIPGTDKADEVVMLGAHFDSWQSGTGATDNAAGSAVMMEAMRILKALNLPMRRTVRIGLWTGEEQGLIGSREYVTAHYADRATMTLKPEHSKFSAYYNVDNGTGAIRGIYLQGNDKVGPIFAQWMRYLTSDSITVGHIAPGNTGGTDHQSFDAVGLPGFQFIQDPVEYNSRTHHSSQDLYERVQAVDMKHNAVAVAAFVYLTANRPDLLPRKPLPVAQQGGGGRAGAGQGQGQAPAAPSCPAR